MLSNWGLIVLLLSSIMKILRNMILTLKMRSSLKKNLILLVLIYKNCTLIIPKNIQWCQSKTLTTKTIGKDIQV